ncbi:response regulator transcription factor [Paenibacillus gorillae]|uniref:response regulator transcription factor n=1 Tax=Paenibacillus gorillae TaxID=1243662 RepID=UPI0004B53A00|nr:response regulator [Paenibacillus gorillae]
MIQAYIVDDESLVRKGLKMIFPWEKYGIEIIGEAASGDRAKLYLQEHPNTVQLLVTDITMPGMTGLELMHWVREFDASIKMVVLTCHQDFDYIQEALRIGAIDYIVKTQLETQDLDELLERIAAKVTEDKAPAAAAQTGTGATTAAWTREAFEKGWLHPLWVWEDESFQRMVDMLADVKAIIPEEWAEQALQKWKALFPQFPGWGLLPSDASALRSWLTDTRSKLQQWLRQSGYSEDMIHGILKALAYMDAQAIEDLSQSGICAQVNISKSYFSRSFKDILRISFVRYVQIRSIEEAKRMLSATNHPVYWIAEQCGFTDTRYFGKMFKEMTGMLPTQYRQSQHAEADTSRS